MKKKKKTDITKFLSLDWRSKGCWFMTRLLSHSVVSFSMTLYLLLSSGSTQEDSKSSQHDWNIVNWEVKLQNKQQKHSLWVTHIVELYLCSELYFRLGIKPRGIYGFYVDRFLGIYGLYEDRYLWICGFYEDRFIWVLWGQVFVGWWFKFEKLFIKLMNHNAT